MLRKVLYLACMNSIQHNNRIRIFYEHLITDNHKSAEKERRLQRSKVEQEIQCLGRFCTYPA